MKQAQHLLFAFLLLATISTYAQVGIGITTPAASAQLDVTSTSKGLLLPRLTTAQRTAIASPATGLIVYDITTNTIWYYDGTAWQAGVTANNNLWIQNGNNIYNTNTANVGIGTNAPNASALLHINTGASTTKGLLLTGAYTVGSTIPDLGLGSRMMFYPGKGAFRAGYVNGTQWDSVQLQVKVILQQWDTLQLQAELDLQQWD